MQLQRVFLGLVLMFSVSLAPLTFAQIEPEHTLASLLLAMEEQRLDDVSIQFTALYEALKLRSQAEFSPFTSQISRKIRELRSVEVVDRLTEVVKLRSPEPETAQFHYAVMMSLSYDLMALTQFSRARDFIEPCLLAISQWQPLNSDALAVQANLYHIYGQLLVRQKRVSEALPYFYQAEDWFTAIANDHPSIFVIQVILGEAYLQAKDYQRAEQFLSKALSMVPSGRVDGLSYVNALLASAIERQQRAEEALQIIDRYLADPVDPRQDYFLYFSIVRVEVLRNLERFDEALDIALQAKALAEELGNEDYLKDVKRHIGYLYGQLGDLQLAQQWLYESLYSPANIREANNPQVYLDYVETLEQIGDYELALRYHREYHAVFTKELEQINSIAIVSLEQDREINRLAQEKELTTVQLALATANENRARLQSIIATWATAFFAILAIVISFFVVQLRRKNVLLRKMAIEDQLTKKGNRRAFVESMNDQRFNTLIIVDIDGLKFYNDKYGHQRGDKLIQYFANALTRQLEGAAAELYRIGGDEFAILCSRATVNDIEGWLAEAVLEMHQLGFDYADASYGYANRAEVSGTSEWTALADMRMYEMKSQRKSQKVQQ